jgi:hypothetical protein
MYEPSQEQLERDRLSPPDCQYPPSKAKYVVSDPSPKLLTWWGGIGKFVKPCDVTDVADNELGWHYESLKKGFSVSFDMFVKGCPPKFTVVEHRNELYWVATELLEGILP